ncbi:MAG: RHS repeat protein, partial [Planctomycetes bacterium]|nr:RHS repeat protein [Planctomycetota bacterium]
MSVQLPPTLARGFVVLLALLATPVQPGASPQNRSVPERGEGNPDLQDERNKDKPTGTGEKTAGDPVEISTGAFAFSKQVLELPGRGRDLSLTLSYVSNAQGIETQTGARWTHDLEERLMVKYTWGVPPEPYPGPADAGVHFAQGGLLEGESEEPRPLFIELYHFHDLRVDYYRQNGADPTDWIPTSGQFTKLRSVNVQSGPYSLPHSFTLRHPNGTIVEFPNALWEGGCGTYTIRAGTITDRRGNQIALHYESVAKPPNCSTGEGAFHRRLESAVDTLGRVVEFDYDAAGWLDRIRDPTGREVYIEHDALGNITAITTPTVTVFPPDTQSAPYASRTEFRYAPPDPLQPHAQHNIVAIHAPNEVAAHPSNPAAYVENTWDPTGERVLWQVIGGTNASGIPSGGVHAFLYSVSMPPVSHGWFDRVRRTLSVDPDGHAELHHFDAQWRPRLVVRFTGGLDPSAVASGAYTIDQLVSVQPGAPSTADQLQSVPGVTRAPIGSAQPAIGCLWQRTDYTETNLPALELTPDARTEYTYDLASPDRFQQGNLLVLRRVSTAAGGGEIVHAYAYEPLFNQLRLEYDPRAFGAYVPPNGGTHTPERYARRYFFDYQEGSAGSLAADIATWSIDVGQASAISVLGAWNLNVSAVGFGADLNGNGVVDGFQGNLVREDRSVRVVLDPQASPPTFRTLTERTTTAYNAFGLPVVVTDPGGFKRFLTYYPASAMAPQPGDASTASHGGYLASLAASVDSASTDLVTQRFGYDAVGRRNKVRNARGFDTTSVYDELDRVVQVTDPLGTDSGSLYDHNGNRIESLVESSTPGMNASTGLPSGTFTFPRFIRTRMRYDLMDNLVEREVQNGLAAAPSIVRYRYTRAGSLVLTLYPEWDADPKNLEASVFDEFGRPYSKSLGGVTSQFASLPANLAIPELGQLPIEVTGFTATGRVFYDATRKVREQDAEGHSTHSAYDGFNRVTRRTTPLGHYELRFYDQASQCTIVEAYDVSSHRLEHTKFKHDERGHVFEVEREHLDAGGQPIGDGMATSRSAYDARGLAVKLVDDDQRASLQEFDGLARLVRAEDAEGNARLCTYDQNGNLIHTELRELESDAPANVHVRRTWTFHDALDRVTASVDELGHALRTRYDTLGRVVFQSDARAAAVNVALASLDSSTHPQHANLASGPVVNGHGNTTWHSYDDAGYLLSTTRHMRVAGLGGNALLAGAASAITTSRTYDRNGRLTSEVDDQGNVTAYRYDAHNRRDRVTYADQTQWTCGYTRRGQIAWSVDARGTRIDFTHDADGHLRLESVTPAAGVLGELYAEFDQDALGRLTLARNAGATVTREYDSLSQLSAEVLNGKRTEIRTSGSGRVQGFSYPGGRVIDHTRDAIGRLKTVREPGASVDLSKLEYRGLGTLKRRDYFNGTRTIYQHDAVLRALDVSHALGSTMFARRTSTWDRQSNRITREDPTRSPVRTFTYTYDSAGRMVRSDRVGGGQSPETIQYALDDVGNRTSVTGGPDAGLYTLNAAHAPLNLYTSTPLGTSTYDANGSLASGKSGAQVLAYDY